MSLLRVLHVEDSDADAELVLHHLSGNDGELVYHRVQTAEEMHHALASRTWDVVLTDYALPQFDGLAALRLLQGTGLDLPLLIVSGEIGEEVAVGAMKAGAHDYIMKDNLARLLPAIERERREAATRQARRRAEAALRSSEARFRSLIENASDLISVVGGAGTIVYASPSHERVLGYTPDELLGRSALDLVHPEDADAVRDTLLRRGDFDRMQFRSRHKDGSWRVIEAIARDLRDDAELGGVVINSRDVTERTRAEIKTAALLEIARDVSGAHDLEEVVARVQLRIAGVLECDGVGTFYLDPARDVLRLIGFFGLTPNLVPPGQNFEVRADLVAGRVGRGQTLVSDDVANGDEGTRALAAMLGAQRLIAAPLQVGDRILGVLVALRSAGAEPFRGGQVEMCAAIAGELALALRSAELYRKLDENARVADTLAAVGRDLIGSVQTAGLLDRLCRLTAQALGCEICWTLIRGAEADFYVPAAHHGAAPAVWAVARALKLPAATFSSLTRAEGEPQSQAEGTEASIRTAGLPAEFGISQGLTIGLWRGDDLVGVLVAGRRDGGDPFGEVHERIARGISQIASLALDNATLFENLERANRLKSDFLATMSHELRTPLNIILGYGDLLLEEAFGALSAEQEQTLRRLRRSASDLLELINATLDLGRLEAGRLPIEVEDVSLEALLAEVREQVQQVHEAASVQIEWDLLGGLPSVRTDPAKLKVVLQNLIGNAVKFTPEGSVTVSARPREDGVELAVADTGVGIAPETLPIIFESFRQGESGIGRSYGGLGLGLYITRQLLDLLGGSIEVESEVGRGSIFRVRLPRAVPARGVFTGARERALL